MQKILIAGSTGYLGSHIVEHMQIRQMNFKALARNTQKLHALGVNKSQIIQAQVTQAETLTGCCVGIDTIISSIGITRQKDGLSYMDVDYQANKNLLEEAKKSGVKKFIYISVLHGEALTNLQICAAKERFVQELKQSGLDYCIIRPSGFFSDLTEFYNMAKKGRVYLFGNGQTRVNPIHGADLAKVCVDAIYQNEKVIEVGGKETFTHQDIAELAFEVLNKRPKITYIPDWVRKILLQLAALVMNKAQYGTIEFFLNVMAIDMATHPFGHLALQDFFRQLQKQDQ